MVKSAWLAVVSTIVLALVFSVINLPLLGRDFIAFWSEGRALSAHVNLYDPEFQSTTQQANGWDASREPIPFQPAPYPPWLAVALWPLSWLPYRLAWAVWLGLNLVATILAGILFWLMVSPAKRPLSLMAVLAMTLSYVPVLQSLVVGQLGSILLLLVAVLVWSNARKLDCLAGLCLGMLCLKPQLGVLVTLVVALRWLRERRWAAIRCMLGVWGVFIGVAFLVSVNWVTDLLGAPQRFTSFTGWAFPTNGYQDLSTVYATLQVALEQPLLLTLVVAAAIGPVATQMLHWRSHRSLSFFGLTALACLMPFLLSPYAHVYDMTLLVWPLIYLWLTPRLRWSRSARYGVVVAVYVWPLVLAVMGADGVWNVPAILGLAAAVLIADSSVRVTQ